MRKELTSREMALRDIADWQKQHNIKIRDENGDVWVINPSRINTRENRKLNRDLGINKVNYFNNTNGCKE